MDSGFDAWQPSVEDWKPLENPTAHLPFSSSLPVAFPNNPNEVVTLDLLDSRSCVGNSDSQTGKAPSKDLCDVVLNVGGPAWTLDWCPAVVPAQSDTEQASTSRGSTNNLLHLAIGCHPHASQAHLIGEPFSGPNCIQLWEIGSLEQKKPGEQLDMPRMSLAIAHDGGATWHCRWCPAKEGATQSGALPRLGLLAAALADGSVRVWAVPQPRALRHHYNWEEGQEHDKNNNAKTRPYVAMPTPVAHLSRRHLGGSIVSRIDWLPDSPNDLLLIGCWDGSVAIAKLFPGSSPSVSGSENTITEPAGMRVLVHFPADTQPLRAVHWMPRGMAYNTVDLANRFMFMTAGHEGAIKVWDARDQFRPMFASPLSTATVLDAAWTTNPLGVVAAVEDGSLRGVLLEAAAIQQQLTPGTKPTVMLTWRGRNAGALWAVGVDAGGRRVAYGGEDGVVGLMRAELKYDKRKRKTPHVPVAGSRVSNGAVRLVSQQTLESDNNGGLYKDRVIDRKDALQATKGQVPDAGQAVQCLAWSPAVPPTEASWLASGLGAGLVRCQWLQKD